MGFFKEKVAFVFTGGGSKGAVQVGMVKALIESGIKPDIVAGSSIGAMNATVLAFHPNMKGIEILVDIWREVSKDKVYDISTKQIVMGMLKREYLFENNIVERYIEKLPSHNFIDTKIKLYINTTKLDGGESVIHSSGNLKDVILASTAIPGIFPPIMIGNEYHIDGGVSMMAPFYFREMDKVDKIFVLDASGNNLLSERMNAIDVIKRSISFGLQAQVNIGRNDKRVRLLRVESKLFDKRTLDFSNSLDYINYGYKSVKESILKGEVR
jgi:predicted acylesterase/phospholipase RssA